MATPERRRQRAHNVEVLAAVPSGAIATAVGAEKARDQYKTENPDKFDRTVARSGPLKRVVASGHVRAPYVIGSALGGSVVYGTQRYQESSLTNENRRQKAAAKGRRIREQIGPKGAGMGPLQQLAKSDRTRNNVAGGALAGGGVLAYSARESHTAAGAAGQRAAEARAGAGRATRKAKKGVLRAAASSPKALTDAKAAGGASGWAEHGVKFVAEHADISDHVSDALHMHRQVGVHTAEAARHLRAAHTKAGVAAGLLATAAAAHASRPHPDTVSLYS